MEFPKIYQDLCTGCGVCIDACPIEAIELKDDIAIINTQDCTNCRACESECPIGAIQ